MAGSGRWPKDLGELFDLTESGKVWALLIVVLAVIAALVAGFVYESRPNVDISRATAEDVERMLG